LTEFRSKPAVPIGGKYRLIDIPISNCIHSGINRIFVLTQFNSASLHRHISTTYRFDSFSDGFVEIMAAEQTQDSADWYQGTADAVRQQLRHLLSRKTDQVLILSGDHLYRMDYRAFIEEHRDRAADVSIAVKPVSRKEAPSLGLLKVDDQGKIVDFCEKPQTEAELDEFRLDEPPGEDPNELYLASMGIYIFEPQVLVSLLMGSDQDDFGKHIIPDAIHKVGVYAHIFDGYWEDIGTIRSFYEANLALTDAHPPLYFLPFRRANLYACAFSSRYASGKLPHRARNRLRRLLYSLRPDRAFGDWNPLGDRRRLPDRQHYYNGRRFRRDARRYRTQRLTGHSQCRHRRQYDD
jgi:glucose-1-phosphate adenylyltransferase